MARGRRQTLGWVSTPGSEAMTTSRARLRGFGVGVGVFCGAVFGVLGGVGQAGVPWWISVYLHELGHATLAWVLGAHDIVLRHHGALGGTVASRGLDGWRAVVVAGAGYLGSGLVGVGLCVAAACARVLRVLSVGAGVVIVASALAWAPRTGEFVLPTWVTAVGLGGISVSVALRRQWVTLRRWWLAFVGGSCVGNFGASMWFVAAGRYRGQRTDLDAVQALIGVPVLLSCLTLSVLVGLAGWVGLRYGRRALARRRDDAQRQELWAGAARAPTRR